MFEGEGRSMAQPKSKEDVRTRIQKHPDLIPSLPDVVAKAMVLIEDAKAEPADFEKLLSRDPPLVANILRLANSPLYGFARKKETIHEAVVGMGLKGLRGVLLCSTMKKFLGPQFACYGDDPKVLWRHATATAAGARVLAKGLKSSTEDPEEIFVAGLLHDLGKLLLAPFLSREGVDLSKSNEPAHEVEDRVLGMTHMEAGSIVAEKWNLKPMIRAVIAHHHNEGAPKEHKRAVTIVRLADQVATANGQSAGALRGDMSRFARDLAQLRLGPGQWDAAEKAVKSAVIQALGEP